MNQLIHFMKRLRFFAVFLTLFVCTLLIAGTNQAYARDGIFASGPAHGGRLIIKRSPVLGANVAIVIYIDGQIAGTLVRHRTFDEYITPGRHVLVASPNQLAGDWRGIIDVRPGHTIKFITTYNLSRLALNRVHHHHQY